MAVSGAASRAALTASPAAIDARCGPRTAGTRSRWGRRGPRGPGPEPRARAGPSRSHGGRGRRCWVS
jgi:hypothetical protein